MSRRDTRPDARDAQVAALRRLGPVARVELAFEMSELARQLYEAAYGLTRARLEPER